MAELSIQAASCFTYLGKILKIYILIVIYATPTSIVS